MSDNEKPDIIKLIELISEEEGLPTDEDLKKRSDIAAIGTHVRGLVPRIRGHRALRKEKREEKFPSFDRK